MSTAEVIEERLNGLLVIKPKVYQDERGFFMNHSVAMIIERLGSKMTSFRITALILRKMF